MITARPPAAAQATIGLHRFVPSRRARVRSPFALGAALAVVAVTVAVDPGGQAPFGPARWAVTSASALALAAAAAVRRPSARLVRLPVLFFVAFLAWTCVAALAGVDPLYAWIGTPERHAGVFAWVLCASAFFVGQALREGERAVVAGGASAAALLAGAWALAEVLGWRPLDLVGVTARPGGPFGSSAYLGAGAVLLAPVAWGVAADASVRRGGRLVAGLGAGLGALALLASGARAAWAGALVAVAVLAVRRRRRLSRRTLARACVVVALVVVGAVATGVADRVPDLFRDRQGGARGRLDEWRVATRVVADHPILGVGPEGYRIAFADSVDAAYERAHGRHPLPDRAHSAVLDVAATTGIPGAVLYLLLLGALAAFAWRGLGDVRPGIVGLALGVLAYFAQSLFLFPVPELDVIAWLLAGIVVAGAARPGELSKRRRRPVLGVVAAAAAVVAAAAGALDVAADRAVTRDAALAASLRPDALRHHLAAARDDAARGSAVGADAALRRLRRAQGLSPRDPVLEREVARLLLERARTTHAVGHVAAARQALEGLARRDPHNAETQLRLGLARALDGDDGRAEQAWLVAERLAPRSAAASVNLAVSYARSGRLAEARAAAERALRRDPDAERAGQVLDVIDRADGT